MRSLGWCPAPNVRRQGPVGLEVDQVHLGDAFPAQVPLEVDLLAVAGEGGAFPLGVAHQLVVQDLLGFLLGVVLGEAPRGELGLVHFWPAKGWRWMCKQREIQ